MNVEKSMPIKEVHIKVKLVNEVKCCCCNSSEDETFEHIGVTSSMVKKLWNTFASLANVRGRILYINSGVRSCGILLIVLLMCKDLCRSFTILDINYGVRTARNTYTSFQGYTVIYDLENQ